ncbi:MAG: D-glycero-beta-D-manno-heptose 1,7-bisphosphate 7-phosphatase [bacterium]
MKLIILDRDGVINEDSDNFIRSPDEWIPIPGSLEAISRLNQAKYHVAVATNQSGIARGYYDLPTLNEMHAKFQRMLSKLGGHIDLIAFCPHGPDDDCNCRKPKPGMYQEISRRLGTPLKGVPVIGDSARDLEASIAVDAIPILVRTGKGNKTVAALDSDSKIPVFESLADAVDNLLKGEQ